MLLFHFHQRPVKPSFLYEVKAAEKPAADVQPVEKGKDLLKDWTEKKLEITTKDKTPAEIWEQIAEHYEPNEYQKVIKKYADTLKVRDPDTVASQLTKLYEPFYKRLAERFLATTTEVQKAYKETIDAIIAHTKEDLELVLQAFQKEDAFETDLALSSEEKTQTNFGLKAPTGPKKIPIGGEWEGHDEYAKDIPEFLSTGTWENLLKTFTERGKKAAEEAKAKPEKVQEDEKVTREFTTFEYEGEKYTYVSKGAGGRKLRRYSDDLKDAGENFEIWVENMEHSEALGKLREMFQSRLDIVADHYLNPEWQKKLFKGDWRYDRYEELSDKFRKGMKELADIKLIRLMRAGQANAEGLTGLEAGIVADFDKYAALKGKPGRIDLEELEEIESMANEKLDLIQFVSTQNHEEVFQRVEALNVMNPEEQRLTASATAELILHKVELDSSQKAFTKAAQELYKSRTDKKKPNMTYPQAKDYFRRLVLYHANSNPRESLNIINDIYDSIHKEFMGDLSEIEPAIFQSLVYREREFLLTGRTKPEKEQEKLLVNFLGTADKKARLDMIQGQGEAIFKAIKNIQEHYPKHYKNPFKKEGEPLVIDRKNLEKVTPHLKMARIKALLIIANECEQVIKNYAESGGKIRGQSFAELLDKTQADDASEANIPGYKFKDTWIRKTASYRSALERGGFNTHDLARKGLLIWGGLTLFINVMQAVKAGTGEGKTFGEKLSKTVEYIFKSPGVWLGGSAAYTMEKGYGIKDLTGSDYEKNSRSVSRRVRDISNRTKNPDALRAFVNSGGVDKPLSYADASEWTAMYTLDKGQIKSLLKKARKRVRADYKGKDKMKELVITNDDLKEVGLSPGIADGLAGGLANARVRYEFYQSFLANMPKKNHASIRELREHARKAI